MLDRQTRSPQRLRGGKNVIYNTGIVRLIRILKGAGQAHHRFSGDVGPKRQRLVRRRDLLIRWSGIVGL